jgi:ribosome biogenesis GTPase
MRGILLKGYGGFYYVHTEDQLWECSLRGRFRLKSQEFLAGDRVWISPGLGKTATIEKVEPRKNSLTRPPIANVDQALIVFALVSPEPDYNLLDRLLLQIELENIQPVLVLTKTDSWQATEAEEKHWQAYREMGYSLIKVSNKTGEGIAEVGKCLEGKTSVMAGPSGVGKSSLLNSLSPGLERKTSEVGKKLKRGRHTTRHVELMPCAGGFVADTPGFSNLNIPPLRREELAGYFQDFQRFLGKCRFNSCLHDREPDCMIKEAVTDGKIIGSRYRHYLSFLQEIMENERKY